MNACVAAARRDVPLKGSLLRRVQHITRGHQKDHGGIGRKPNIAEHRRILGAVYGEARRAAKPLESRDCGRDCSMAIALGAGKKEDAEGGQLRRLGRRGGNRARPRCERTGR